ncbi:3-methyl-2-oxobutanoate hydroxymethyltransferase [Candidatus Accumulibacter sp. ACC003]|uniref:3-methyl-2-oxobutanoate hydroxymethyltransferase n=1 Tax=Candidatus Accumulibacter sp. ACC003 TaxID=2823334 RepID=UPI0025C29961|nr:3-methyl-2-oxobutanoate hydroxymethyltransferase [Candidatus Accumulibacter sp. ACC003]
MSTHVATRRLTHVDLAKMRAKGDKIAMLTCYDASFAQLCEAAGVDVLLIGDSLGMVLQGHDSTLPVTLADVAYHTASVARASTRPLVIADMPFGSFQESPQRALRNAVLLLASGAQMVKLEGGAEMVETTRFLTSRGIPVCAHVGLTPQSVHQLGGYRVQGKDDSDAARVLADALAQQNAGATLIVLEAIPVALAVEVTERLAIPTIGIGASRECSGQVLVLHDMLDISSGKKARFVRNFMSGQASIAAAIAAYVTAVKDGSFPAAEHCY